MKLSLLSVSAFIFASTLVPSVLGGVILYRSGNASKPYAKVRTPADYDDPVNGIVPANGGKGMSMDSIRGNLNGKHIWKIDADSFSGTKFKPVNDHDTHYALTLTQDTEIGKLLDDINNSGWSKT